jgi:hypothetical protein
MNHFLKFINSYGLTEKYLTNDVEVTDEIMTRYVVFLQQGFSIKHIKILAGTIEEYLRCVNVYYKKHQFNPPFSKKSESDAAKLVKNQESFEDGPNKREPLHDRVLIRMYELAQEANKYGLRRAIWLWTRLGCFGGFRRQEFIMDKRTEIQFYVMPDGTLIVRAFTLKNFVLFDVDKMRLAREVALAHRERVMSLGTVYDVQKNRMNNQMITFNREPEYPEFDPVEVGLDIIEMALALGAKEETDPLCLYRTDAGDVEYITGDMVTKYFRFVTKLVFPAISDMDLKLLSCHSLRVKAAVILHEAGKDGTYIKLRIRWLSDCFEVYLRNTHTICEQHNTAMRSMNEQLLKAVAVSQLNLPHEPRGSTYHWI